MLSTRCQRIPHYSYVLARIQFVAFGFGALWTKARIFIWHQGESYFNQGFIDVMWLSSFSDVCSGIRIFQPASNTSQPMCSTFE